MECRHAVNSIATDWYGIKRPSQRSQNYILLQLN